MTFTPLSEPTGRIMADLVDIVYGRERRRAAEAVNRAISVLTREPHSRAARVAFVAATAAYDELCIREQSAIRAVASPSETIDAAGVGCAGSGKARPSPRL